MSDSTRIEFKDGQWVVTKITEVEVGRYNTLIAAAHGEYFGGDTKLVVEPEPCQATSMDGDLCTRELGHKGGHKAKDFVWSADWRQQKVPNYSIWCTSQGPSGVYCQLPAGHTEPHLGGGWRWQAK